MRPGRRTWAYVSQLVSGKIDYPPSHQWTARAPVIYCLKNMILWGLGVPLGLAVWASWILMAYEMLKKHKWAHLLPWVWMTFTFFYQSVQFVKTVRYLAAHLPHDGRHGGLWPDCPLGLGQEIHRRARYRLAQVAPARQRGGGHRGGDGGRRFGRWLLPAFIPAR